MSQLGQNRKFGILWRGVWNAAVNRPRNAWGGKVAVVPGTDIWVLSSRLFRALRSGPVVWMSFTTFSAGSFGVADFRFIFTRSKFTMGQNSSLLQWPQSVSSALMPENWKQS